MDGPFDMVTVAKFEITEEHPLFPENVMMQ